MKWDLPSPEGTCPHSIGRNFTGLYLLLVINNRDKTIEGTPASIPNPNKYKIGRNCVAVSPAKLEVAENRRYKYLIIKLIYFLIPDFPIRH